MSYNEDHNNEKEKNEDHSNEKGTNKNFIMLSICLVIYGVSSFYAPEPTGLKQSIALTGILFSVFMFGHIYTNLWALKQTKTD